MKLISGEIPTADVEMDVNDDQDNMLIDSPRVL